MLIVSRALLDEFIGHPEAANRIIRQVVGGHGELVESVAVTHEASRRAENRRRYSSCLQREVEIILAAERQDRDILVGIERILFQNQPSDVLERAAARSRACPRD